MPKALIITKMKQAGADRGAPDTNIAGLSFVHCGIDLPGAYRAMVVTGSGAALAQLSNHANFVAGQQIQKNGDVWAWQDSRTKIAAGALIKINTWLQSHGHKALTAQNSIVDLLRVFAPGYEPGQDDVFDAA